MEISSNLKSLIREGYNLHCNKVKSLMDDYIHSDGLELLESYLTEDRRYVESHCKDRDVDLISVLMGPEDEKSSLGKSLVKAKMLDELKLKSAYDAEVEAVGIKTVQFTNGIEQAPWLALFGSPLDLKWFTRNSNNIIKEIDHDEPYRDALVNAVEAIRSNWVDPQKVAPDLKKYHDLMSRNVPGQISELVAKHSGN